MLLEERTSSISLLRPHKSDEWTSRLQTSRVQRELWFLHIFTPGFLHCTNLDFYSILLWKAQRQPAATELSKYLSTASLSFTSFPLLESGNLFQNLCEHRNHKWTAEMPRKILWTIKSTKFARQKKWRKCLPCIWYCHHAQPGFRSERVIRLRERIVLGMIAGYSPQYQTPSHPQTPKLDHHQEWWSKNLNQRRTLLYEVFELLIGNYVKIRVF